MTVADQLKILDRNIKQNEAQCDLGRKAAKIWTYSSNNLGKYEYLTSEDLNYKPDAVEQARFEYSPSGKIFKKGMKEEDKKEGLLQRSRNIEDKNEEQLEVFSRANKISRSSKNESDYNYDNKFDFSRFYRDFKIWKKVIGV